MTTEPRSSVRQNVLTLVKGNALAQMLALCASPLLSRLYAPASFGVAAQFSAIVTLLVIPSSLRFEQAVQLPNGRLAALRLLLLALTSVLLFTSAVAIGVSWIGRWICEKLGWELLHEVLFIMPLAVLGYSTYQCLTQWALRNRQYEEIASTRVTQTISNTVLAMAIGLFTHGALGLVIGFLGLCLAGTIRLGRSFLRSAWEDLRCRGTWALHEEAKNYASFAGLSCVAGILNSLGTSLPPVVLATLYGESVAGSFAFALRIIGLPMTMLGAAVSQVFMSEAAMLIRERQLGLRNVVAKTCRRMVLPAIGVLVAGFASRYAFKYVFGDEWTMSGRIAGTIAVYCSAQLLVSPVSSLTIVLRRQGTQLTLDLVRALLVVGALYLPSRLGAGPEIAIATLSAAMTLVYLLTLLVLWRLTLVHEGREVLHSGPSKHGVES